MARTTYTVEEVKIPSRFRAKDPVFAIVKRTIIARTHDADIAQQIADALKKDQD